MSFSSTLTRGILGLRLWQYCTLFYNISLSEFKNRYTYKSPTKMGFSLILCLSPADERITRSWVPLMVGV